MVLEQNITITQGDTKRLLIPVLDGDSADDKFLQGLQNLDIEFAISDAVDETPIITSEDVEAETKPFGDTEINADAFDEIDSIPDTQEIVVITIPAATSNTLAATPTDSPLVYQVRLNDGATDDADRITPVVGEITVDGAVITSDGTGGGG